MYPMDFEEYLWALNDTVTIPAITEAFQKAKSAWRCDPQKDYENISYLYGGRRNATGSGGIGQWKNFCTD